jgi:diguanylate cyclase (GGDEF)-like protein
LADQIRDRHVLDHQLAAAVEQGAAARHAALHDALTDLPNRALFDDRLEHGLANAERHGWNLAVMFLDMDGFKAINDSHGHHVCDSLLRTIAQRLRKNARSEDTVSRYGGDEFLFLLTEIGDPTHVALIAKKMAEAIQMPCEIRAGGVIRHLSVRSSIGISLFPKDGSSAEMLVKNADAAMYRAKRSQSGYAFAI